MTKAVAHIDGASRGNPGAAAIGVVFLGAGGEPAKTISRAIGTATNNTAETLALIFAMQEALIAGTKKLEVFTDSELVARQFSGEYRVKEPSLKQLHLLVSHLRSGFDEVTVKHVPREKNKLADAEANRALDSAGEASLF